jgi:hypothetical protein
VSATGFTGLAASAGGATRNNLVVAAATGTAGSLASTLALTLVSNANGVAGLSDGTAMVDGGGSITTSGTVYTGQSTWNTNGGGSWGSLAAGTNWTSAGGVQAAPGTFTGYASTDSATFAGAVTGGTATMQIQPARDWDGSGRRYGATEKSERELGFRATVCNAEGLRRTVEWTKEHREVIRACMQRHAADMARVGAPLD